LASLSAAGATSRGNDALGRTFSYIYYYYAGANFAFENTSSNKQMNDIQKSILK
jgi:hypothetical protein